jgi:hypothetical protein
LICEFFGHFVHPCLLVRRTTIQPAAPRASK